VHDIRRTRLVLTALLIVAIALITLDYRSGGQLPLRGAGSAIFGPVERGAGYVTRPVVSVFDALAGNDSATISQLQKENDQLRAQLSQEQAGAAQVPQLASVQRMAGQTGYHVVTADVVAAGGSYSDTVTIDEGTAAGIKVNDTVLNGQGLVGTVTQAGPSTATVDLASDANSLVGVRLVKTGTIGAVSGTGASMAQSGMLRLVLFGNTSALAPGQELVTFGSIHNTPYVPGIPVGTIARITSPPGALTQTAEVHPFVDFSSIGVVGVVVLGQQKAG
jgi:rod shape-determining protein MreC